MICKTTLITTPAAASVEREDGMTVSTSLIECTPAAAVSRLKGLKVATAVLFASMVVACAPVPAVAFSMEVITPITRELLTSNFITIDEQYVMTADGRIFFVQEE